MLKELKEAALSLGLEFRPNFVSLDFEEGAINAFKSQFPLIKIIGCWFHFAQCLFRKLVEFGLKVQYGEDERLKKLFQSCAALPLMPYEHVNFVFEELIIEKYKDLLHKYPVKVENFLDYILRIWVEGEDVSKGPLFPIKIWNH